MIKILILFSLIFLLDSCKGKTESTSAVINNQSDLEKELPSKYNKIDAQAGQQILDTLTNNSNLFYPVYVENEVMIFDSITLDKKCYFLDLKK